MHKNEPGKAGTDVKNAKKQKKQRKPFSILLLVLGCAVIVYFTYSIIATHIENKSKEAELSELQTKLESQVEKNSELQSEVDNTNESDLAEQYARKNGSVKPGEKVYYFY